MGTGLGLGLEVRVRVSQVLFWIRPSFVGRSGGMPTGNVEILLSHRRIFLYFEVYCYFALLFLDVNHFEQIWRKKK